MRLSAKFNIMKIGFHSYAKNNNFHMKNFAFSLTFRMRFIATRKWPIKEADHLKQKSYLGHVCHYTVNLNNCIKDELCNQKQLSMNCNVREVF